MQICMHKQHQEKTYVYTQELKHKSKTDKMVFDITDNCRICKEWLSG